MVEVFTQLAAKAESNLAGLALRQEAGLRRREALRQIEDRFRQMQADGSIDESEMAELMRGLDAQQLDTESLKELYAELKGTDSAVRDDNQSKFADALTEMLDDAIEQSRDSHADLQFAIQQETSDATNYSYAASQLSRQEHDLQMRIIGNMKA